jgi:aryl-alcohol dehydrogenase-like predicted oxidoreductase
MNNLQRIGFGTWQLGGESIFGGRVNGWANFDEKEAEKAVLFAIENGIVFFDTADGYGRGQSEMFLGKLIGNNPNVKICTKFGNREDENAKAYQDFTPTYLIKALESSLQRLKRDNIDTLLFHSPADDFDWENYDKTVLENLVKEGKIQNYGVSSKTLKGVKNVLKSNFGTVNEALYNALDRRIADEILPISLQKNSTFIARVPLASGFLSTKIANSTNAIIFPNNDIRSLLPLEAKNWFIENSRKLAFLNDLEGGITVSALRFCLSNLAVSYVIPGMKTEQQVKDALLAAQLGSLSAAILEQINEAVSDVFYQWR